MAQSDEDFVLSTLPSINDLVSETNPISWHKWLLERCEVRGRNGSVTFWGVTNHNYLVYRGRVLRNYGYHGRNAFTALSEPVSREKYFAGWAKCRREIDAILFFSAKKRP